MSKGEPFHDRQQRPDPVGTPVGAGSAQDHHGALNDWLEERGDPRAADVWELSQARCVTPVDRAGDRLGFPLARGRWWQIYIDEYEYGVWWQVYDKTPQVEMVGKITDGVGQLVKNGVLFGSRRPTPRAVELAFKRCRRRLICALFRQDGGALEARHVLWHITQKQRLAEVLRDTRRETLRLLLCALRAADPAQFDCVMQCVWARKYLHDLGYMVMDTLQPGWRARVHTLLDGPPASPPGLGSAAPHAHALIGWINAPSPDPSGVG